MFLKIITAKRFWLSVLFMTLAFIVLFNLIRIVAEFKFDFKQFYDFYLNSHRLASFIVANLIGGIIYGFSMAYYRYWRHFKRENRNQ